MKVGELLSRYPSNVQSIAREFRVVMHEAMPDAEEQVKTGWSALTYHHPRVGLICGFFPYMEGARIYFEHGAFLDDPDGLFDQASAKRLKRTRYIEIHSASDIQKLPLINLIHIAIDFRTNWKK